MVETTRDRGSEDKCQSKKLILFCTLLRLVDYQLDQYVAPLFCRVSLAGTVMNLFLVAVQVGAIEVCR